MAHAGETHLFLEKIFDLQSPSWPWRNPNWKTQAWIKCAGDTSNSSNWNHFKILKCKKPLFIFKQSTIYLWLNLPQKLSQPVAFQRFPSFAPLFEQVQTPLPLLNFSPHLLHTVSHWAMIMMRKTWAQTYTTKSCPETTWENYRNSRHPLCLPLTFY